MTAFVDGQEKNIYVDDSSAKAGEVFRYTEVGGVYSLISPTVEDGIIISGKREFIQSSGSIDEIAYLISEAKNTTIELTGRNYYTLSNGEADSTASVAGLDGIKFVCDKNSVIIVNDGGKLMMRSGAYSSTISVKDGAKVTAVFDNEIGSVETLKFLYISDGSLGNYDLDAGFVRILDNVGQVYETALHTPNTSCSTSPQARPRLCSRRTMSLQSAQTTDAETTALLHPIRQTLS